MDARRYGIVSLLVGGALWTQLVAVPLALATGGRAARDVPSLVVGLVALATLAAGVTWGMRRGGQRAQARWWLGVLAAGYPAALGLFALVAGRNDTGVPRFDLASRLVAGVTAFGFVLAVATWDHARRRRVPVALHPLDAVGSATPPAGPAPPLRHLAFGLVCAVAVALVLVAPAWIATHDAARLQDEPMLRGREAITSAGGLLLGCVLVVQGGQMVLRGARVRRTSTAGALGWLVWGLTVYAGRYLLDHLR